MQFFALSRLNVPELCEKFPDTVNENEVLSCVWQTNEPPEIVRPPPTLNVLFAAASWSDFDPVEATIKFELIVVSAPFNRISFDWDGQFQVKFEKV